MVHGDTFLRLTSSGLLWRNESYDPHAFTPRFAYAGGPTGPAGAPGPGPHRALARRGADRAANRERAPAVGLPAPRAQDHRGHVRLPEPGLLAREGDPVARGPGPGERVPAGPRQRG